MTFPNSSLPRARLVIAQGWGIVRSWLTVLLALACVVSPLRTACDSAELAAPVVASEDNAKILRLFMTLKYFTWPDDPKRNNGPFVIGVVAPEPFDGKLKSLNGRKVKDRSIEIVHINDGTKPVQCHALFIPAAAKPDLVGAVLKQTANEPVLTWFEKPAPDKTEGVACAFLLDGDELLISVDPVELKRRKLVPEAQLLSLKAVRLVKPAK